MHAIDLQVVYTVTLKKIRRLLDDPSDKEHLYVSVGEESENISGLKSDFSMGMY